MRRMSLVLVCALACSPREQLQEREPTRSSSGLAARGDGGGNDASASDAASAWSQFSRHDDVPLCLFARHEDWWNAQFLGDVKEKVSLKAGGKLYLGAYAPGCADPDCIRRITLQCWADVEGKTITVHTRFSGEQQAEQLCQNNCQPASAACNTPGLTAGVYTITHGARQRTIRIPGLQQPACF
jgi:hypothetical protein